MHRKSPRNTNAPREAGLVGVVVGAFRLSTVVEGSLAFSKHLGIDIEVLDPTPAAGERVLYARPSKVRFRDFSLGLDPDELPLAPVQIALEKGDLVLLLSDGIPEARSAAGEEFGEERVLAIVRRERERPAAEIIRILMDEARRFSDPDPLQDDMTVVVVKL